ncbi:MAG: HAMP domain-containing histidine kinase [Saprospiraceae bacterium]|nr:HAMP domain-containing histidine kinase [Pyrinomonadaceae bacterium]
MRRSWFSILVVAGVIGLLAVLGVLQYRWQRQISESDREKIQKRVEMDAGRFAEDFNKEIQAAYFNFQMDAESWQNADWASFNERYDFWKNKTAYPELVKELYFVGKEPGVKPIRYNAAGRTFDTVEPDEKLQFLITQIANEKTYKPVYDDAFALGMPVHKADNRIERIVIARKTFDSHQAASTPEKFGYLIVMLDERVIKERVFPDLVDKYFPGGEFNASVTNTSQQAVFNSGDLVTANDAAVPLLDLSPDNFMFFANREMAPPITGKRKRAVVLNQRIESQTFSRTETNTPEKAFKIELQKAESAMPGEKARPGTAIFSGTRAGNDPWRLNVQHRDGSVDNFIAATRRTNLAVGFGILSLLAISVIAIFLSAQRARVNAQRQVDFVSSVSHEFRTPLAVIYSAGENLADGVTKESSQISRYGNLIKGEGKKLSAMVEQILEFAGANSSRTRFNFREVNLNEIIEDALAECGPLMEGKGFSVETDIPKNLSVKGDRDALSRSVQNLIANSIKYSNGEKWLKVSASNGGKITKIIVEDRGFGIAKSDLRKIFQPFYRSKSVVDAQIHGNGLGLSIVKQIIEGHGGKVFTESEIGKGSRFVIELPR